MTIVIEPLQGFFIVVAVVLLIVVLLASPTLRDRR